MTERTRQTVKNWLSSEGPDTVRRPEELIDIDKYAGYQEESRADVLERLRRLKTESDRRNYKGKAAIFRRLMVQRPDEFVMDRDPDDSGIMGITHEPTNFKFHLPADEVSPAMRKRIRKKRRKLDNNDS